MVDVKIAIDAWKPDVSATKAYRVHSKHRNIAIFWYARSYKARAAYREHTGLGSQSLYFGSWHETTVRRFHKPLLSGPR